MLVGIIRVLNQVRPLCSPGSAEVQAIDSQLRRFQRRLLVAEARECIATGNALGGLAFLERIPDGDRGPSLSLALRIAALWPEALSIGYRTRRVLRRARRHALSMRA